jgi:hypothetical protein
MVFLSKFAEVWQHLLISKKTRNTIFFGGLFVKLKTLNIIDKITASQIVFEHIVRGNSEKENLNILELE